MDIVVGSKFIMVRFLKCRWRPGEPERKSKKLQPVSSESIPSSGRVAACALCTSSDIADVDKAQK